MILRFSTSQMAVNVEAILPGTQIFRRAFGLVWRWFDHVRPPESICLSLKPERASDK